MFLDRSVWKCIYFELPNISKIEPCWNEVISMKYDLKYIHIKSW